MRVLWICFAIFAAVMGVGGLFSYMSAQSAPQQCAAACFALAGVVIPYLFLRGTQEFLRVQEQQEAVAAAAAKAKEERMSRPDVREAEGVDVELVAKAISRT